MRPRAIELGDKGRRVVGTGQDKDLADGSRERHMEDAPLSFFIVTETVGEQALRCAVDHHVLPFSTLDLVDGRKEHGWPLGGSLLEHTSEPHLEGGNVGVEGCNRLEGKEVVGMGRPVGFSPGRVQHVHRLTQADLRADGPQGGRR